MTRRAWLAVAAAGLLAAGCGPNGLAPVRGRFVYPDGQPAKELAGCTVTFDAVAADGRAFSAQGEIDAEGRFELTTTKPGDGATIGKNRVSLAPHWPGNADKPKPLPVLAKYASADTSGLEAEVKPGGNDLTLTVEPAKK